jgi:Tol biopolymer transport system component
MNADGSELNQVTQPMPEYQSHGSPDWSPDGKRIAFDGWTGNPSSSRVFVVNDDGTGLRDLGIGIMPTFSPDGDQLAFTWSGRGMAIMNFDGTGCEVITREGWGAQWSSNGRWISYAAYDQGGANVAIIDLKSRERTLLLEGDHATRYSRIDHNMEWSIDASELFSSDT